MPSKRTTNIIAIITCVLIVGAAVGGLVWYLTLPNNIGIVAAEAEAMTPPSLELLAADGWSVRVDSTRMAETGQVAAHWITVDGLDELVGAYENATNGSIGMSNITLHLTQQDVSSAQSLSDISDIVSIEDILGREFPYRLPDEFDPSQYTSGGVVFTTEDDEDTLVLPTSFVKIGGESVDDSYPLLLADLDGRSSYRVSGFANIEYRWDLSSTGSPVRKPILRLVDLRVPDAPGPFLYLSKRPSGGFQNGDIYIPIDGTEDNSYTKSGSFAQDLDEITAEEVADYSGGSFIVWCVPFTTTLGSGTIEVIS